ncbi:Branched-chain amino acid aminotransferase/4-amino-4-deoxychorismate lyase [Halalkaliarchaeum sp. AArc-CO]|uniref:branched-chain amino acid transaminase n=1 Tax=unclassified Halalkaliarchaeum TaxID=2678344 RepID=UPI00217D84B2|nr:MULTISPECIES: branched-chain amino acid transaminase [unclassified Halalkaliarchaeum]MDR5673033.1 branched-chain amino acid transaminase [Halalkaliarchaeum sp. AArc-GB]UWG49512.1 Branched-chain amino acid aminotransferase/4-amino-4-deoxychorismate lyase [Halalkaliarchaeum sp. AArc-CO]
MAFHEMDVDTIWLNGEFVDWEDATTHVLTHALHYGTGVFEGVRCYDTENGPAIFRWDEHLDRLYDSAKPYELDIGHTHEELTDATLELLRREGLESCYIRPIAYYGYHSLGVSPGDCPTDVAIAAWPWGAYLGEEALENGVDVMVSSWRKHASSQIPTNVKTTGLYVNSMLAGEEARRNGYVEAIVLNKEGNVAEGPGENLFMVNDGEIYTTGPAQSILEGITRDTVITLAEERGYAVHDEAVISRGQLYTADELFFTGSAAEVTPIRKVDNVEIGGGTRGPVTEEIQQAFFELVERKTDAHDDWFTYV